MKEQKKNLLVTLADENYIDKAKQLFSSVYFNAGWKGDYMLLAHEIPKKKLKWFKDKGILIKQCNVLSYKDISKHTEILIDKFYLFTPEFKKWENIIYLDADIIVRASLNDLTKVKGFAAPDNTKLAERLISPLSRRIKKVDKRIFWEFKKKYDLNESTFGGGIIAFNTNIIEKDTFAKLKQLFEKYKKIDACSEELSLILLFNKKCKRIPFVYCVTPTHILNDCNIPPDKIDGIILHFCEWDPWDPKNPFYKEWRYNLDVADLINLDKIQTPKKRWTKEEIKKYRLYLKENQISLFSRYIFRKIKMSLRLHKGKYIGLIGLFLKYKFPVSYYKLKDK